MGTINGLGEVISAALKTKGYGSATAALNNCFGVYSGEIIKIHTHDSGENNPNGGEGFFTF